MKKSNCIISLATEDLIVVINKFLEDNPQDNLQEWNKLKNYVLQVSDLYIAADAENDGLDIAIHYANLIRPLSGCFINWSDEVCSSVSLLKFSNMVVYAVDQCSPVL